MVSDIDAMYKDGPRAARVKPLISGDFNLNQLMQKITLPIR